MLGKLVKGASRASAPQTQAQQSQQVKTIKLNEDGKAGLQVGPNTATVVATGVNGGAIGLKAQEDGIYLSGKLSIMTSPSNIRVGGFWVQNSPWRQMLPSNLAFPNPVLKMNSPTRGIEDTVRTVNWFMSLLI